MSERIIRKCKEKLTLKIRDNSVEDRKATSQSIFFRNLIMASPFSAL